MRQEHITVAYRDGRESWCDFRGDRVRHTDHLQRELHQRSRHLPCQDNALEQGVDDAFKMSFFGAFFDWRSLVAANLNKCEPGLTGNSRSRPDVHLDGRLLWQFITPLDFQWPIDGANDGVAIRGGS